MGAAVERLSEAREAHARRDWPTAYQLFSDLRRTHPLEADDLYALSDAAWWLGLIRETLEVCEETHRRYLQEGRVERAALVALDTGFHWFLRGQPDIGSGWISRARRLLADLPEGMGHAMLVWLEATELAAAGDVDGALEQARRLHELAATLDAPVLSSFGLALEGEVLIRQGDTERGFGLLDEAMLPVLAGQVPPDMAGNLYCQMMTLCHQLADVARARRWTEATEAWCDGFESAVMFVGVCRVHRCQLLRLEGSWRDAEHAAVRAAEELAELNVEAVAEARYELGEIHRLRGELAAARSSYAAAARLGREPEPGSSLLLLAEGRADEAATALRRRLAECDDPFVRARLLRAQVDVAFVLSDAAIVSTTADELALLARTYRSPGFRAWAESARGTGLLLAGATDQALAALRDALSRYQSMRATYDVAVTRLLIAEALAEAGDAAGAEAEAATARAALTGLGAAVPFPAASGTSAGRPAPAGLTARETEVLLAVTEGLSNREVAARLVISERTVARHLANIYAKIGVSSRTAAAAWAHRHGVAASA